MIVSHKRASRSMDQPATTRVPRSRNRTDTLMPATDNRPRVALTMGDVAGVGPEVIAQAWSDPTLHRLCQPLVIGDPDVLRKAIALVSSPAGAVMIDRP